jgi:hypothetical protein
VSAVVPTSMTAPGRSQLRTIASYPHAVPDGDAMRLIVADAPPVAHCATMPSPLVTSCRTHWRRRVAIAPSISRFLPEITEVRSDPDWLIALNSRLIGKCGSSRV